MKVLRSEERLYMVMELVAGGEVYFKLGTNSHLSHPPRSFLIVAPHTTRTRQRTRGGSTRTRRDGTSSS
jgi:hypothetical protein